MLRSIALFALVLFVWSPSFADQFPKSPDHNLTPGELCKSSKILRYKEKIKYCERDVSTKLKKEVFIKYDQLGYRTRSMRRLDFKIDHYIPLCAGGSNSIRNLWPQHASVYKFTDQLEQLVCEKMAQGRLSQKRAVDYVVEAKNNLERASYIISVVRAL